MGLFKVFLVFYIVCISPVVSQEITNFTYGDWQVTCTQLKTISSQQKIPPCYMSHRVIDGKSGQQLFSIKVVSFKAGQTKIGATAPLGVILAGGVKISIDDKEAGKLPFLVCVQSGCQAEEDLTDNLLKSLSTGKKASAGLSIGNGQQLNIPFSNKGFKDAFAKLVAMKAD